MKRYKRYFKEDSLKDLTDDSIPQKLVDFIKKNPFPKDHEGIHKFAEEELKIDADILEQYVYAFLTVILFGGKSKGDTSKISKEQLDIGFEIEYEHVNLDSKYENNKVIKAIQDIYRTKVSADHDAENDKYYTTSTDFQDELKQEDK
jgi:hypothetical protein